MRMLATIEKAGRRVKSDNLSRCRRQRQADLEATRVARPRRDDRVAAMQPRNLPDQRETKTHAPGISAEAMERRKHPLALGFRNAGAIVHDLQDGAVALAADRDAKRRPAIM